MCVVFVSASLYDLNLILYRTVHIDIHSFRNFSITVCIYYPSTSHLDYSGYRRDGSRNICDGEEYGVLGKPT